MIEPSSVLSGGKNSLVAAAANTSEQGEDKMGGLNYFSATEEKFSDNISTASEASETTSSSKHNILFPWRFNVEQVLRKLHTAWIPPGEKLTGFRLQRWPTCGRRGITRIF